MKSDTAVFITMIIGFIIIPIVLVSWLLISLDSYSCRKTAESLGYGYEYSVWTGCILRDTNGKKFLLDQLRELKMGDK